MSVKSALAAVVGLGALTAFCAPTCPVDVPGMSFAPELSDEFDGGRLDAAKWMDWNPTFTGRFLGFMFASDNVAVSNGCLCLTARMMREDEKTSENLLRGYDTYATAIVKSRRKGCYGYYECRAKTMRANVCNAFWLYDPFAGDLRKKYAKGMPLEKRKFVPGDVSEEVDIFEVTSRKDFGGTLDATRKLFTTVHAYTTPYLEGVVSVGKRELPERTHTEIVGFDFCDDFHTYGFLWTETELVWYLDGREVFRRANDHFHRPLCVTLDSEIMYDWFGIPDPKDLPATFEIDYVRVWRKAPSGNTALVARPKIEHDGYDWYARHDRILAGACKLNPEVLFVGDSITHFWACDGDMLSYGEPGSAERWLKHFGKYRALNLGFGWDRTGNVLWRLAHGEADGISPKKIVLNIGGNNFSTTGNYRGNTVEETEEGVCRVVETLHAKFPSAEMAVMGVFPFGRGTNDWHRPKIAKLNASLAKTLLKYPFVRFIDITDRLVDTNGVVRAELFTSPGGVHPNTAGYDVWAEAIKPFLEDRELRCPLSGEWKLDESISDAFDGSALDRTKWLDFTPLWRGRREYVNRAANVSVTNGCLELTAARIDPAEQDYEDRAQGFWPYTCGIVKSRAKVTYGYFEVRAKGTAAEVRNAFWLYDPLSDRLEKKYAPGSHSEEIDIYEFVGRFQDEAAKRPYRICSHVHRFETPYVEGLVNRCKTKLADEGGQYDVAWRPCDDYHVYGLLWNEKEIVWYVDGVETYRRANDYYHTALHVMIDVEIAKWRGAEPDKLDNATLPASHSIDWFRRWVRR